MVHARGRAGPWPPRRELASNDVAGRRCCRRPRPGQGSRDRRADGRLRHREGSFPGGIKARGFSATPSHRASCARLGSASWPRRGRIRNQGAAGGARRSAKRFGCRPGRLGLITMQSARRAADRRGRQAGPGAAPHPQLVSAVAGTTRASEPVRAFQPPKHTMWPLLHLEDYLLGFRLPGPRLYQPAGSRRLREPTDFGPGQEDNHYASGLAVCGRRLRAGVPGRARAAAACSLRPDSKPRTRTATVTVTGLGAPVLRPPGCLAAQAGHAAVWRYSSCVSLNLKI